MPFRRGICSRRIAQRWGGIKPLGHFLRLSKRRGRGRGPTVVSVGGICGHSVGIKCEGSGPSLRVVAITDSRGAGRIMDGGVWPSR